MIPASPVSLGVYCEGSGQFPPPVLASATYAWSTGQTAQRIEVVAPASGQTATFQVTVNSPGGTKTLSATLQGAGPGTPRCTLGATASQPITPDTPFAVIASCSPAATSFTWVARSFTGSISLTSGGSGATPTFVISNTQPGDVIPIYLTPGNSTGTGPATSLLVTAGNPNVAGPLNPARIAGGLQHTCALTTVGGVKCWGDNAQAQLGDFTGAVLSRTAPVNVIGSATNITAITTGYRHACALNTGAGAKCWGDNSRGQLGDGSLAAGATNVLGLGSGVATIATSASSDHTCAVLGDGSVRCWGRNDFAQLGNASTLDSGVPVTVTGLSGSASSVAAGGGHSCVVTTGGAAWCWGRNTWGQLGNGTTTDSLAPVSVAGLSTGVVAVAAAYSHTCALMANGTVKCWGWNGEGELGNASFALSTTPVDVVGLSGANSISAGANHTCVLTNAGAAKCWGRNTEGQLGDGTLLNRNSVVDVSGMSTGVVTLGAGGFHTCAVVAGGGALCWGSNDSGRLGNGTYAATSRPSVVIVERGGGSLDGNDWFLDLDPFTTATIPGTFAPKMLVVSQLSGTSSAAVLGATAKYRSTEFGKNMNHYVLGLVPPAFLDTVKAAPASSTSKQLRGKLGETLVLVQLTPAGWMDVQGQLIAYSQGVASAAGGATTILTGTPLPPGGRFCVGYGESAQAMLTSETLREVLVAEGAAVTASGLPCVLSGVYVGGPASSVQSSPVTFTASIVGISPTGSIRFKDGTQALGPPTAAVAANPAVSIASLTTSSLSVGAHSIGADYLGDTLNVASTSALPLLHTVSSIAKVELAGPASSELGREVVFAATVTGINPTGTVQFRDGLAALGTPVPVAGGIATLRTSALALGGHAISAAYGGDFQNAAGTSSALAHTVVNVLTTGVQIASSANPTTAGAAVTLTVTVTGSSPTGTATLRDGAAVLDSKPLLGGAASFQVTGLAAGVHALTADYSGDATNPPASSGTLFLEVALAATTNLPRLANISTRGRVQTGNEVMIGGFIISGASPKKVLITARGPSLTAFGVSGAIANPTLQLFSGQTVIAVNDDWQTNASAAEIAATGIAPANPLESALLMTLNPGAYTAIVSGVGGGMGVGIVEVFELDRPDIPLVNISTRGLVQTGESVMIGGFIIYGDTPKTVLITARGPSLAPFGITNPLANPTLQLFSGQTAIAANDDWQTNANAAAIQATGVAPTSTLESAILITLNPGAYTAIVSGAGGGTGVGIVEVFAQ